VKRTQVKIFNSSDIDQVESKVNEFLDNQYERWHKSAMPFEIVDIKMTEDDYSTTATIIYTIGC